MGIDRRPTNFPTRGRLSQGLYLASTCLWLGQERKRGGGEGCNAQLCVGKMCKMISIMFQPLHDQRSSAYSGKDRRRIPGLSKAQRRIKASSTPALLDRDVERWVRLFLKSVFIIRSISWGSYSPDWILSASLGSCRMIVSRIFILVLIVSTRSFRDVVYRWQVFGFSSIYLGLFFLFFFFFRIFAIFSIIVFYLLLYLWGYSINKMFVRCSNVRMIFRN